MRRNTIVLCIYIVVQKGFKGRTNCVNRQFLEFIYGHKREHDIVNDMLEIDVAVRQTVHFV